jgi:hypothetical protein
MYVWVGVYAYMCMFSAAEASICMYVCYVHRRVVANVLVLAA